MANGCVGVGPVGSPSYSSSKSLKETSPSCKHGMYLYSSSLRLVLNDPLDESSLSDSESLDEADKEEDDDESWDFFLHSFLEALGTRGCMSLPSSSMSTSWKSTLDLCSPCCVVGIGPSSGINGDLAVFPFSLPDGINPGGSTNLQVKS